MEKNHSLRYTVAACSDPIWTERLRRDSVNCTLPVHVSHSWSGGPLATRVPSPAAICWSGSPLCHQLVTEHQARRKGTDIGAGENQPQTPDWGVAGHAFEIGPATCHPGPSETPGGHSVAPCPMSLCHQPSPGASPSFHFLNLTATFLTQSIASHLNCSDEHITHLTASRTGVSATLSVSQPNL